MFDLEFGILLESSAFPLLDRDRDLGGSLHPWLSQLLVLDLEPMSFADPEWSSSPFFNFIHVLIELDLSSKPDCDREGDLLVDREPDLDLASALFLSISLVCVLSELSCLDLELPITSLRLLDLELCLGNEL